MMISYLTKPCIGCHEPSIVELDKDKLKAWEQGDHVQIVWPEKSADERELLITGTHGTCWDKMFGEVR